MKQLLESFFEHGIISLSSNGTLWHKNVLNVIKCEHAFNGIHGPIRLPAATDITNKINSLKKNISVFLS